MESFIIARPTFGAGPTFGVKPVFGLAVGQNICYLPFWEPIERMGGIYD